jgi:iron-sulfur cluster assembly accessory protein
MVTLTERAAEEIRDLLAQEAAVDGGAESLRVAVQGGGCSGFQYALGFDGPPQPGDAVAQVHGITVVVDRFSLPYLEGAGIDYVDGLMGQGFTVNNPNAVASCGCGKSFTGADADPSAAPAGPDGCASGCSA